MALTSFGRRYEDQSGIERDGQYHYKGANYHRSSILDLMIELFSGQRRRFRVEVYEDNNENDYGADLLSEVASSCDAFSQRIIIDIVWIKKNCTPDIT